MERFHQSFEDAFRTPRRVRTYLLLYASVLDGLRKLKAQQPQGN